MIAFNLACYASVTGRMEEAKKHLRDAIALDKDIRELATDDEDLRPLWDWSPASSSPPCMPSFELKSVGRIAELVQVAVHLTQFGKIYSAEFVELNSRTVNGSPRSPETNTNTQT